MLERFERPIKIVCLAMAALLAWQLGYLILRGDPLAHLEIPSLPMLAKATNDAPEAAHKETNTAVANGPGTNGTNVASTNSASGTNAAAATNALAKSSGTSAGKTNTDSGPKPGDSPKHGPRHGAPNLPPGMPPEMMAMMGGMPGGPGGGGRKKVTLPPEIKSHIDKIIESEIFGPIMHPMPMVLIGIVEEQAFIQATNGQTGPVKVGGEIGGIKLLRIGINRVLVEQGGEKKELTLFDGIGGESLMPNPSTNTAGTNAPSTNAPASFQSAVPTNALASQTFSPKQKEIP